MLSVNLSTIKSVPVSDDMKESKFSYLSWYLECTDWGKPDCSNENCDDYLEDGYDGHISGEDADACDEDDRSSKYDRQEEDVKWR